MVGRGNKKNSKQNPKKKEPVPCLESSLEKIEDRKTTHYSSYKVPDRVCPRLTVGSTKRHETICAIET